MHHLGPRLALLSLCGLAACGPQKSVRRDATTSPQPTAGANVVLQPSGINQVAGGPAGPGSPTTAGGAASTAKPSGFISGINVAWIHFAADVGTGAPDLTALHGEFAKVAGAGGKIARLWLHTDGSASPAFSGMSVTGPGATTAADLSKILDAAHAEGIQLLLTLWSFDMLRAERRQLNADLTARNRLLLTDSNSLSAYLDNALTPLVTAVKDHPALYAWDVVNEPEGMTTSENWSLVDAGDRVSSSQVQTFINRIAGRIHKIAPSNQVTSGALSYKYLSSTAGSGNFYTDAALKQAGGDALGYLDFYQVHHYDSAGKAYSPFLHPASYFGADKPVLIGEFALQEYLEHGVALPRLTYAKLQELGYLGALGWQDGDTPAMNLMLNAMVYLQFPADLGSDPNLCSHFNGGYGKPFYSGTTLYRLQTASAQQSDATQRCAVE